MVLLVYSAIESGQDSDTNDVKIAVAMGGLSLSFIYKLSLIIGYIS